MSSTGRITRIYPEVQNLITKFFESGRQPTTIELQNMIYGESYNIDSRVQRNTIYGCITRGRENAIILWNKYIWKNPKRVELGDDDELSEQFCKDLAYIMYYEIERVSKELKAKDFNDFRFELQHNRFGEDTEEIKKSLGDYVAVAIKFEDKMQEFSKLGHNFLMARKGKTSTWFIPSLWRWNIREFELYRRTLKILRNQLKRGIETKVMLPSAQPIEKVLKYETIVRAAIENKTVWKCPKCNTPNIESSEICVICKTLKN